MKPITGKTMGLIAAALLPLAGLAAARSVVECEAMMKANAGLSPGDKGQMLLEKTR